jgi:hypothetical protein
MCGLSVAINLSMKANAGHNRQQKSKATKERCFLLSELMALSASGQSASK